MTYPIYGKIKNVPNHQPGNEMNILLVNPLGEMDTVTSFHDMKTIIKINSSWCS